MTYDLQGRLSQIIIQQMDASEEVIRKETQVYIYNAPGSAYAGGSRVQQVATVEVWNETTQTLEVESVTETTYHIDASNPTGYTQTLVELAERIR